MRSTNIFRALIAAAAVVATVPLAAQTTSARSTAPRSASAARGPMQQGGGLFAGINLTASQRAQIKALRAPGQFKAERGQAKTARNNQDPAAAKAMRGKIVAQRKGQLDQIRAILTASQLKQFDANLTARQSQRKSTRMQRHSGQ